MFSPFDLKLAKRLIRRIKVMAKNARKKGKSARRGNSQSPYQKYGKKEFQYSQAYQAWKRNVMAGRATSSVPARAQTSDKRMMAAE